MKSLILFALVGAAIANPLIIEDDAETRGLFSSIAGAFGGALSSAAPSPMDIGSAAAKGLWTNMKILNGGMDLAGMSTLQKVQFAYSLGSGDLFGAIGIVGSAVSDKVKKQFGNPDLLNNLGGAVGANKTQEVAKNMGQLATAVVGLVGGKDVPEGADAAATTAAAAALNGTTGADPAEGLRAAINAVVASMAEKNPKIGAVVKKGIETLTSGMSKLSGMVSSGYFNLLGGGSSTAAAPSTDSGSTTGSDSETTTTSGSVTEAPETTATAPAA